MFEKTNKTYFTFLIIIFIVLLFFIVFAAILIMLIKKNRILFIGKLNAEYLSIAEERQRISKDLHDEFGALLSSTKMYLSTLNICKSNQEILEKSIQSLDQGLDALHRITNDLYPGALNKNKLNQAILDLIHELCNNVGLKVNTNIDDVYLDNFFVDKNKVQIYWILKEIIINTLKHAQANKLVLNFRIEKNQLEIYVVDNGIGFNQNILKSYHGNGLMNIANRVEILHGSIYIDTEENKGVKFFIKIPINR